MDRGPRLAPVALLLFLAAAAAGAVVFGLLDAPRTEPAPAGDPPAAPKHPQIVAPAASAEFVGIVSSPASAAPADASAARSLDLSAGLSAAAIPVAAPRLTRAALELSASGLAERLEGRVQESAIRWLREYAVHRPEESSDAQALAAIRALPARDEDAQKFLLNLSRSGILSDEVRTQAARQCATHASGGLLDQVLAVLCDSATDLGLRWALAQGLAASEVPGAREQLEKLAGSAGQHALGGPVAKLLAAPPARAKTR
ncbi:MAG: hypothetical protein JNJ88_03755 [Planctomycetes bacterium]|nr:hypothetical protein [Planctomycetota bacterium]